MSFIADCQSQASSLAYEAPSLKLILILSAFLVGLNVCHDIIDDLFHVGLLAQLVLGAVFGLPLTNILPADVQQTIQSFGYLGLLLLVFEGGMTTRLDILSKPKTLILAFITGSTGILIPIGFSMILLPFAFSFTYLQSFVVGVSLSSTSLGTTLAVVATASQKNSNREESDQHTSTSNDVQRSSTVAFKPVTGIMNTRIGTILIGAALLDDIVALVLSSVVRSLGTATEEKKPIEVWPVVRPFLTSFLLILITSLLVRFVIKPLAPYSIHLQNRLGRISTYLTRFNSIGPPLGMLIWLAILSSFIAIADKIYSTDLIGAFCAGAFMVYCYKYLPAGESPRRDPKRAFEEVKVVLNRILLPFFFSSIGFAIPVKELFNGETVWKGILYSGLMAIAKVMACLPVLFITYYHSWTDTILRSLGRRHKERKITQRPIPNDPIEFSVNRPWLPAIFLGFSLVARGEIGFLILNIARQNGILSCSSDSQTALLAFNVGIWAITLNTFIGPTIIGILTSTKGCLQEIESGPWGIIEF